MARKSTTDCPLIEHPSWYNKKFGSKYVKLVNKCYFAICIHVSDDPDAKIVTSKTIKIGLSGIHTDYTYGARVPNTQLIIIPPNDVDTVYLSTPVSYLAASTKHIPTGENLNKADVLEDWRVFIDKCPISKQYTITFTPENLLCMINTLKN